MNKWSVFAGVVCVVVFIVSIVLLGFVIYGMATDCPDTVGYVYCGGDQ